MGSIGHDSATSIWGEFMHPVITDWTDNGDPWQRKYFAPPSFKPLVPRKYPIHDVRSAISAPDYSALDHLKADGFGVVKHHSTFLDQLDGSDLSQDAIAEIYHPETKDLIRKTLGCKDVFIVGSVFRQGRRAAEAYQLPTERRDIAQAVDKDLSQKQQPQQHRLAGQSKLQLAAPIRAPHMDFTPLGARQAIRFEQKEMYNAAVEAGIIAAEDAIYADPVMKDSDSLIAERYNTGDAPRYAAYSIWRPLRKVGRDPLAICPRKKGQAVSTNAEFVHHFYENRLPGAPELKGDFLKEYAMFGVSREAISETSTDMQWFYVSEQEPDEVLFIKLFDSAALGEHADNAPAPWHASPEIGDAAKDNEPRESIDIRVVVLW